MLVILTASSAGRELVDWIVQQPWSSPSRVDAMDVGNTLLDAGARPSAMCMHKYPPTACLPPSSLTIVPPPPLLHELCLPQVQSLLFEQNRMDVWTDGDLKGDQRPRGP